MNSRIKMIIICILCLLLGAAIYLLSRTDTYLNHMSYKIFRIETAMCILPTGISFYLPDFLWAAALCSGLFALWPLGINGFIWGIITFLYGALWELLQLFSVVKGTADLIDVMLYLMAAFAVVMINYFLKTRKEK